MKAIKVATNKVGTRYAIIQYKGAFAVFKECRNYDPHIRGGIAKTWRYCEPLGLSMEEAEKLLAKKEKGRSK